MNFPPPKNPISHSTISVVLLEDQSMVRQSLGRLVADCQGIEMTGSFSTLEETLAFLEKNPPHVVVLDVIMPGRNMFDVARLILEKYSCKVLLLDEFPLESHIRQAVRVGASGYLTKQDSFADLEEAIRRAGRGEKAFSEEIARRLGAFGIHPEQPSSQENKLAMLTPREIEILIYLSQGFSVKQVADILTISPNTVDNHKSRMMRKLKVHKTVELTRLAIREGLVPG